MILHDMKYIANVMTARRLLPALLLTLFPPLALSAQPIAKMEPGRTPDGIVYFLPKTELHFHLLVEQKTYQPGAYAKYAEKYLRMRGVQLEQEVTCSLADVTVSAVGVRDTSKCYVVRLKGGHAETAELSLSADGVLLAVNDSPMSPLLRQPFKPAPAKAPADVHRYLTNEVRDAGSTAKQAELTAQLISDLQEQRRQLITGDADNMPQDETQLRLMLSEIDREHQALMSLFVGTVSRDTTEHHFTLCPDGPVDRDVAFRLSKRLGLVDSDDLSGVPFYISIKNLHPSRYPLPAQKKSEGFIVNVPGMARLSLFQEDLLMAEFDIPLAQFGFTELRDGQLFRRYVTHMQLHPATGAVVRLHADTEGK